MSSVKRLDIDMDLRSKRYWISSRPPIYVWLGDEWFNEREQRFYKATEQGWTSEEGMTVDYPTKTVYKGSGWEHTMAALQ